MAKQNTEGWHEHKACLRLPAIITIDAMAELLKTQSWQKIKVKQLDFSQVEKVDSAILALVLFWYQQLGEVIELLAVPDDLQVLIDLYDLHDICTISSKS
ncbi:STAS domain-containing protein [Thiomicrorhabdus sediminis]|uniref:STAS domain-containing protein n=1 Tax=Thiomicrorhabdus sediminis TaxID=2580412 RepID=A0A4P9K411_9GAMM|nr:STAS domain-containing protein [Thiomicrorhabdus sediminis]QCU89618.1 STAS domain-containing protein [Thiomicrorhabdus sediminis]